MDDSTQAELAAFLMMSGGGEPTGSDTITDIISKSTSLFEYSVSEHYTIRLLRLPDKTGNGEYYATCYFITNQVTHMPQLLTSPSNERWAMKLVIALFRDGKYIVTLEDLLWCETLKKAYNYYVDPSGSVSPYLHTKTETAYMFNHAEIKNERTTPEGWAADIDIPTVEQTTDIHGGYEYPPVEGTYTIHAQIGMAMLLPAYQKTEQFGMYRECVREILKKILPID